MVKKELTDELRAARRILEGIRGYERVNDYYWDAQLEQWILQVRLRIDVPGSDYVPVVTEWYILIDPQYPLGQIAFKPATNGGIKHTFQHQNYNWLRDNAQWREGKLCLDTSQGSWGRKKYSTEPVDARNRLKWHIERCLIWLVAAATNTLVERDDPYELPDFPSTTAFRLVFNEDSSSFATWQRERRKSGLFVYCSLDLQPAVYPIHRFDIFSEETAPMAWGTYVTNRNKEERMGIWLMLNQLPVQKPWQIPPTFKELFFVCQDQGVDLVQPITNALSKLQRQDKQASIVTLGFPVPNRIESPNELIHWFAFELVLPKIKGHRNNELGWKKQLNVLFASSNKINWIKTENWNSAQLTNRGRVPKVLTTSRILFIGAGAVGSVFAELFGRLGCGKLTFVDHDKVQAGNLSRHTLTLNDVGRNKAEALSDRLNSLFPFHTCTFRKKSLEAILRSEPAFLDGFDVVIDATAEDSAIQLISQNLSNKTAHFFSVSTGLNADRLYCYMCPASGFINLHHDFKAKTDPWLQQETIATGETPEIIEGIGCWHPLFPARIDDIQMLAGVTFKLIERQIIQPKAGHLAIAEKQYEDGLFKGVTINYTE